MKPIHRIALTNAFIAFTLSLANTAFAEMPSVDSGRQPESPITQMKTSYILNKLHHLNQMEIQMGELAKQKAQTPELKQMANRIVLDHRASDKRITDLAKARDLKLAKYQPATQEKGAMDSLKKLKDSEFDHAFLESQRFSHKMAIEDLQALHRLTPEGSVKTAIQDMIPEIQKHLSAAESMDSAHHKTAEQ